MGNGKPGAQTEAGGPAFFEPGGLSVAGDELFVADTNNHRVVQVNLTTRAWREVTFEGLHTPSNRPLKNDASIAVQPISIGADAPVELLLEVRLPAHAHVAADAPWSVRITSGDASMFQGTSKSDRMPLRVLLPSPGPLPAEWQVELAFAYCTDGKSSLCVPCHVNWNVPVSANGHCNSVTLSAQAS
jgi:hypothetical protein